MNKLEDIRTIGLGVNFKEELVQKLNSKGVTVDFYELTTEYFFPKYIGAELQQVVDSSEYVLHGLDLSIGTNGLIDKNYLSNLDKVLKNLSPRWISDHFAYTRVDGYQTHQLMPIQFSKSSADGIIEKIDIICSRINKPFLLENITYYYKWPGSNMHEVDFYNYVFEKSNAGMLLDLNNLYINSRNHDYDPYKFIDELDSSKVVEIHLAGGVLDSGYLIDTHAHSIGDDVWKMLEYTLDKMDVKGVVVERDRSFEDIDGIIGDINKAKKILAKYDIKTNDFIKS